MSKTFFDFNKKIYDIQNQSDFELLALDIFKYQYEYNLVYNQYCSFLNIDSSKVTSIKQIPFLPISIFKTHKVTTETYNPEAIFTSSGTSGMEQSQHLVKSLSLYRESFMKTFEKFYGSPTEYIILGLLPSYLERKGSSLIDMVNQLISSSKQKQSGFYLNNLDELATFLKSYTGNKKILLIGVSYALLDLAENYDLDLSNYIVMETGGMKGKRSEMTKQQLHHTLNSAFNTRTIHSEYGMTELLSQAYAKSDGLFLCPPWMKVLIREYNDPFVFTEKKTGGINIIDLANLSSCSFIATDDLGKINGDYFEVLGRFDFSDLRGCNLLVQ